MGPYQQVKTVDGVSLYYWREFQKGYVFVNPTTSEATGIGLAQPCKQLSHDTINQDPSTFADISTLNLPAHRAAFLVKSNVKPVGRYAFYNNSAFDGNDPSANASDDAAIATDKSALLPGETATFDNYTSYSRGINGIMIDLPNLPGTPTAADFTFKVGNSSSPSSWSAGPAPTSVTVRRGAGVDGSDRVTLIFADGAVVNRWLQVTLLSTPNTGASDVFYFGNAVGDTGNSATNAQVTPTDQVAVRDGGRSMLSTVPITDHRDIDRDHNVGSTDQTLIRNNGTNASSSLNLISVP